MNRHLLTLAVCCTLAALARFEPGYAGDTTGPSAPLQVRVGTFDSRLVATAYVRSKIFARRLAGMRAELEKAKAAGDQQRAKQLEAAGPALQALVHKQAFSTWPVHDILRTIHDKLPDIAREAQVDLMVSKWDIAFQAQEITLVDVTDRIVAQFHPDQATRKVLDSLRDRDPVPIEQLDPHK